ncbi:hypothetical protein BCV72DRAFT_265811 [Rhizopus microsporus var. microsporus]|uniref:Uncharacterized protein n=2 Tax=Rhizopus microsporus TaxID=58291 RepID=A0A2G4SI50_RHIZD|nr:uncharacterized protein RHIMIDRAFT_316164 [Rhizopus microsporus ATCC 52813]ORE01436.1 hypothetical protein BCV72DRAFT_265811 [Rhizopus microsporus var. microsporus]PHZ08453.1 hypothetical protein RHIMIDRAFT_316164 [Rhizopus microsporus ATCC 52813]
MIYGLKPIIVITLLFFLLVNGYKIVYCDDNGCIPQESLSILDSLPSSTILSFPINSSGTTSTVQTSFHEDAVAHAASSVSENASSDSSNWKIIMGSIGGIFGAALVAAAIFVIRHARQKPLLLGEAGIGIFSTDNDRHPLSSPNLEAVEQEKGVDDQMETVRNARHIDAVCVIPMDDAKSSLANREWKQLMKAIYQQGLHNKSRREIQSKKKNKATTSKGNIKKNSGMKQEEASNQQEACDQEDGCNQEKYPSQEQNLTSVQGEKLTSRISRALDLVEPTPNRLSSTTIDGVPYLRSQSVPNLVWSHARSSARPFADSSKPTLDSLLNSQFQEFTEVDPAATLNLPWLTLPNISNYSQQAVLLGEGNSSTEEQSLQLENEKNKERTSTEEPQNVTKEEANEESLIRRFIRETESLEQVELSPSVIELIKQCKIPVGLPKNFREKCVPVHFRIYGLERMEREKVKIEEINKLVPYVFDGPNKHHYPAQYHHVLERDVQRIKNRGKEPVNEKSPLPPAKKKKSFSFSFWQKKTRKFTTAMIRRTDISLEDLNADSASSSSKGVKDTQQNKQAASTSYGSSSQTDVVNTELMQPTQRTGSSLQMPNRIDLSESLRLQENEVSLQVADKGMDVQIISPALAGISAAPFSSTINSNVTKDTRTTPHSSTEPGSSSASRTIKHYEDAIPHTVRRLLNPPTNK